jgi:ABC-type glutathione transport system ATPase component
VRHARQRHRDDLSGADDGAQPRQTIGDQVAETLTIHGQADRAEALKIARDRLDRVGLSHIGLDAYPHELSGGQRQRVCIARPSRFTRGS